MTSKEYLNQIRVKDAAVNRLIRQKENLKAMLYSIGSIGECRERVQTSKSGSSRYEDLLAKISEKEEEIDRKVDDLINLKMKVCEQINDLPNEVHISVLYERYIELKSWNKIATDLGYNTRYLFHIHGDALNEFYKKYENQIESYEINESI